MPVVSALVWQHEAVSSAPADGTPWSIVVATGREHRPVTGDDTTILAVPEDFYIPVEGSSALDVVGLSRFLRRLCEAQAAELGEELHHADFLITTDPAVVQENGITHDCDRCRTSLAEALAFLAAHPNTELLVGQLFWAGP
jgi:hypothetical protein